MPLDSYLNSDTDRSRPSTPSASRVHSPFPTSISRQTTPTPLSDFEQHHQRELDFIAFSGDTNLSTARKHTKDSLEGRRFGILAVNLLNALLFELMAKKVLELVMGTDIGIENALAQILSGHLDQDLLNGALAAFIFRLIIKGPISFSEAKMYLAITNKHTPVHVGDLFEGFKGENLMRAIEAHIMNKLYSSLWGLLFVIPGIIHDISCSQTFYLLASNPTMDAATARAKSKQMMKGHKIQRALLNLPILLLVFFVMLIVTLPSLFQNSSSDSSVSIPSWLHIVYTVVDWIYFRPFSALSEAEFHNQLQALSEDYRPDWAQLTLPHTEHSLSHS